MPTDWAITTTTDRISLDAQRHADVTFTVTNPGAVQDRAVFEVVASENANRSWFTVELAQRVISAGASVSYVVKLAVPPSAPAGSCWVTGRVYSADSAPEESSRLSPRVAFDVAGAAAPRAKPWWLLAVAFLVVVVLGVTGWLVLGRDKDEAKAAPSAAPKSTAPVSMPDLAGMTETQAASALQKLGLTAGAVRHRHVPGGTGKVTGQSVAAGAVPVTGSAVDLEVAVTLSPAALSAPANNATFIRGQAFPALAWQPVPNAAGYRVKVQTEVCVFLLVNVACTFSDQDKMGGSYASYHSRSFINTETPSVQPQITLTVQPGIPRAGHSGNVRWQVVALDDFGNPGPESGFFQFHMVLREPDAWGPISQPVQPE